MAQLERLQRSPEVYRSPANQTSPTFEQLLQGDANSGRISSISPTLSRSHNQEEDHNPHGKKSVLTKVKEKAKKLRYSLSGKKKHGIEMHDDNVTPPWGVSLEDDDEEADEDPEYLGAPMYESELAPETYKETARQHPRADPVVPENHSLASCIKTEAEQENCYKEAEAEQETANREIEVQKKKDNKEIEAENGIDNNEIETENEKDNKQTEVEKEKDNAEIEVEQAKDNLPSPNKTIREAVTEKLAPAYAAVSDATHTIASKIVGLTIAVPEEPASKNQSDNLMAAAPSASPGLGKAAVLAAIDGPRCLERSPEIREQGSRNWDKGVSVKEYFMQKVEPGEDERALSQVISQAISPRRSPAEMGVVEKVKEAVTSFLRPEESSSSHSITPKSKRTSSLRVAISTTNTDSSSPHVPISNSGNSSPLIPISTSAHEVVEEQNHGRILQAN